MQKLNARVIGLRLANPWKIASTEGAGTHETVIVELADGDTWAIGEAAPSILYGESAAGMMEFLQRLDPHELSFGLEGGHSFARIVHDPQRRIASRSRRGSQFMTRADAQR